MSEIVDRLRDPNFIGQWAMRQIAAELIEESVALLIKFAWNNASLKEYQAARALVIRILDLDDSRPVDIQKRKDALNAFLAERQVEMATKLCDAIDAALSSPNTEVQK